MLFEWSVRPEVYLVLLACCVAAAFLLLKARQTFALRGRRLALFLVLLLLTVLLNSLFVLYLDTPDLLPPVSTENLRAPEPVSLGLPLLGIVPVVVAAAWLDAGPALFLGLLAGVLRAGLTTHSLLDPFIFAFYGAIASYFLRQDYRGRLPWLVRQPAFALLAASILIQPLVLFFGFIFVYEPGGGLVALDYAISFLEATAPLTLVESLACGILFQLVYLFLPGVRPALIALKPPPYGRTLNRRLQFIFTPLFVLMIAALVYAVSYTAFDIATEQAKDAIVRDATNGADGIWQFISTGQSLIRQFAGEQELWTGDQEACEARLQSSLQMLPYFSRLTAYDTEQNVLCTYPPSASGETALTFEEMTLFEVTMATGGLQITRVHRGPEERIILSFLGPLEQVGDPERWGVLIGRVEIDLTPHLEQVLTGMQWAMGQGEGFVVDSEGRIVVHRNRARLLEQWELDESAPPLQVLPGDRGWVRETRHGTTSEPNARYLACYVAVEGHPWGVVVLLPQKVILNSATRIASPLLLLLAALAAIVAIVIPLATSQLTRPLNALAQASERIAEGDLNQPVHVVGDDEVAQLGDAFEDMRIRLRGRLEDLSLLLRVAQEVSATLDISQGLPYILEGAIGATDALVSRIVVLSADGEPQVVVGRGQAAEGLSILDRALAIAARDVEEPRVIEDLRRAHKSLLGSDPLPQEIRAVIALPVRSKGRAVAVMWTGFAESRSFDRSEVDLLSTLASQTAVLIENSRLFQLAEGGRRRLAAILASTDDAILVTDREDRLLLVNPSTERVLGMLADELIGQHVEEVPMDPILLHVMTEPLGWTGPLVEEVPLPDGRVFYASASTILSADGENMGRVVVMRDITHFKELDELKSEFVSTVSHDLRAPLTFMRGYATMLPMVGEVNEKQQEYLDKILVGVEKMGNLIEDLLNLGRIEAGVGLEEQPCHVGAIVVEAVDGLRARAVAKGLILRLESSEPAPVIVGDGTLLRQAVANLVDNAIKYTPPGGTVTVGMRVIQGEIHIAISDTGYGIAPEDQVRLFEKFYRVRRREYEDIQGSGLGLAIVKSIVERHGGRVWVDSTVNEGSVFTLAVPIRTPSAGSESGP
ncbi:MAG: HAMP domain-containing protein [Anaerolineae bacterium]|nr:HAMP domain-containing protein [Anaerolineae bacterium]